MNWKLILALVLFATIFIVATSRPAHAQAASGEPEMADQIDTLFDRASTPANQQRFLSVLVFVVLGGAATFCVFKGIKKVVHVY